MSLYESYLKMTPTELTQKCFSLMASNQLLEEKRKIAVEFIKSVPDAHENYGHELIQICQDVLKKISEEK